MNQEQTSSGKTGISNFRNWISLAGLITVAGSLFAFVFLFIIDLATGTNPYLGILTYLITPMFSTAGVAMILVGVVARRKQVKRGGGQPTRLVIDLSRPRDRRVLGWFMACGTVFLFITAIGTYHSYHFTESTGFCGRACHAIMEPEYVTYQHSSHARVGCVECHIGPGAEWYVKAKLSGLYQVYATFADKHPRPVPTPIHNLRPAQDTCEQCHWPQKFSGNIVRTHNHFLSDATNTAYSVRLMLKVGGGDPRRGPVNGIHWHVANKVEYLPADPSRQKISYVRYTDTEGKVIEYRSPDLTNEVNTAELRKMDCMDCHNRPAHTYQKPNEAVDQAIAFGTIDASLPSVRSNATQLLVQNYATVDEAVSKITEGFQSRYKELAGDKRVAAAADEVKRIYRQNFFPYMKANWRAYPENIGHKDWPGCVRCHDDRHTSAGKKHVIGFKDCNACHLILAQGATDELDKPSMSGQAFKHPGEEYDPEFKCHDCHTGGP